MSDQMNAPTGGGNAIKDNMSIFNPADMAAQAKETAGAKTVADVLAVFGISPEDPAEKLMQFGKNQVDNANPMTKMDNIRNQAGSSSAPPTTPAPAGTGKNPLDQLVGI
jgi:hypothetical protein